MYLSSASAINTCKLYIINAYTHSCGQEKTNLSVFRLPGAFLWASSCPRPKWPFWHSESSSSFSWEEGAVRSPAPLDF